MEPNNPYRPPPDDLGLAPIEKPDLAYWVYVFIALKLVALVLLGALVWYAHSVASGHGPHVPLLSLLAWLGLGALAAVGVGFRVRLAKHLLVVHLAGTAALELYAFVSMMGLEVSGPLRDATIDYGWLYFVMALWDLIWAAVFQFSRSLRAALA